MALERSEHVVNRRTRQSHQCRVQNLCSSAEDLVLLPPLEFKFKANTGTY